MIAGSVEEMVPEPLTTHRSKQATNLLVAAHIFHKVSPYLVSKNCFFTTPWAYSTDDKLTIFFSPENRLWHFMQIVS